MKTFAKPQHRNPEAKNHLFLRSFQWSYMVLPSPFYNSDVAHSFDQCSSCNQEANGKSSECVTTGLPPLEWANLKERLRLETTMKREMIEIPTFEKPDPCGFFQFVVPPSSFWCRAYPDLLCSSSNPSWCFYMHADMFDILLVVLHLGGSTSLCFYIHRSWVPQCFDKVQVPKDWC